MLNGVANHKPNQEKIKRRQGGHVFSALLFCKEVVKIKFLAIDQAKATGYALFENRSLIEHGVVELGRRNDIYEDILLSAKKKIRELIEKTQADIVIIEDIQQQHQNVSTYKKLAMLMGALICLFQEMNKPFEIVPSARWKSFSEIKGKKRTEQKENTLLFVKEKFGLEDISQDTADAVALGWYAANNIGLPKNESP